MLELGLIADLRGELEPRLDEGRVHPPGGPGVPLWEPNIVSIRSDLLPSGPLALQFYEGFPTPFLDEHYHTPTPPWDRGQLPRRLGYDLARPFGPNPLPTRVSNWLEADDNSVTLRTTITNEGSAIIDEIGLGPCLAFRHCPEMFDDTGERMFFRHEGRWKNWTQLRRYVHTGWWERVQHFDVAGKPSHSAGRPGGYRGQWGTSPDFLDVSLAARVHPRTGLAVGIAFDRSHSAAGNCNPSHYCIHSYGLISDLCPGETRTRTGRIFFCKGGLDEVWERYQRELTPVI